MKAIFATLRPEKVAELADTVVEAAHLGVIITKMPTSVSQKATMKVKFAQLTLKLRDGFRFIRLEINSLRDRQQCSESNTDLTPVHNPALSHR